jgi:lipoprotein-releasing system ATP-binding protein
MNSIIELKNVDKTYPGGVETQVLFNVNLQFEYGSCNAVVGESGSGKSTLLNIIGTLDKPTRGAVIIAGRRTDIMDKNRLAELRNETIGFVFQFHYLLPEFTAMENALMPYLISKRKPLSDISEKVVELFDMLGIAKWKNSLVTKLSGGQQQRVAIARALINNPKILLADEPSGNLDSDTTEKICNVFREINEKYGTTFVVVTHDHRVAEHTDRIVEIKDGRIIADTRK